MNTQPDTKSAAINAVNQEAAEMPSYSDVEEQQISAIQIRLFKAQQARDTSHPELNDQTYIENYENNERIANTFVKGKKFEGDIKIASGTVEQKMFSVLAEVNRLSLSPQVLAFDEDEEEMASLGLAMTDVLFETAKKERDDEKRLIRQMELLKQGTVFVQEMWTKRWKKYKTGVDKSKIGKFQGVDWTEKLKLCWDGPERNILYAPGVYLGNIKEIDSKKQPYIFTHKLTSYEEAKSRYGMKDDDGNDVWERWKYVPRERTTRMTNVSEMANSMNKAWTLTTIGEGEVEEVHYQDKFNDEYQIFLNGIPQLPVGFPLSVISPGGEYNIDYQVYQFINPFFAYGRSFVQKVKEQSDILDELLKLLIIKTRKSIHPPYANSSGRVISSRVLMPGRITMGIDAGSLQAIGQEGQGVISSEFQMYQLLQNNIDENTVSKQFTGSQGKAGQTATESNILQAQAQKVLSLTIFSAMNLEMKLGYLRLWNVLENYFEPYDTRFNETKKDIEEIFRRTVRKDVDLENDGRGIRQIIPTMGELPPSSQVREEELYEGMPAEGEGMSLRRATRSDVGLPPVNKIYLNPERLKKVKIAWYIDVDTREKETSNVEKLMFREELADLSLLMNMGARPKMEELQAQYALIWNRRKDKMFEEPVSQEEMMAAQMGGADMAPPVPNGVTPEQVPVG